MLFVLSVWNLDFLHGWRVMIFASPAEYYFMPLPQTVDYIALLILLFGGASISFLLLRAIRRYMTGFDNVAFLIFVAAISVGIGDYLRDVIGGGKLALYIFGGLAPLILAVILWQQSRTLFARAIFVGGLLTAPFALSNMAQAMWHIVTPSVGDVQAAAQPEAATSQKVTNLVKSGTAAHGYRVVWLLFDELDERALFGERRSGYQFKAFDQFRAGSVHFDRVRGVGGLTIVAMPSLWLGTRVTKSETIDGDTLNVTLEGTSASVPVDDLDHLFRATWEAGLHTALVGYYHPYCRIFRGYYDRCETYYYLVDPRLAESQTLGEAIAAQISVFNPFWYRATKIEEFRRSVKAAAEAAADEQFDLVAVHAGFPHSPWVFDARTKQLSLLRANYLDNVALADYYLAIVRQSMLDAGVWDRTAIIITADHGNRDWQGADSATIGAVPFLVKLPYQRRGRDISCTLDAIVLRRLIEGLLRGQVPDDQQLESCLHLGYTSETAPVQR
jgi:hypothetical protein